MNLDTVVPIISGGIDSTVMLWYFANNNYRVIELISFNYGQRHKKEIQQAKLISQKFNEVYYDVKHKIVDIESIGKLISHGAITGNDELPEEMYDSENQRVTVVPNRNMIFLSIAAGRAVTLNASTIGYAAHASDYSVYPDCRPEFIEALNKALLLGNLWNPVNLEAPFKHLTKTEIIKLGIELQAPLEITWSCYSGNERPCLSCGTCLERTEAFMNNNTQDPALTDIEWKSAIETYNRIKNKTNAK